ncbi:MAG: hypothetical protein ACFB0C_16610 [Leptolyngbyaceae cyanobacterium]
MFKQFVLLISSVLMLGAIPAAADDFYCYLELENGQSFDLGTVCGGEDSFGISSPFGVAPRVPTTDTEAAFLTEYTVAFFARNPDLAEFAPTEAAVQEAVGYRDGFEEILDNAYRLCQGRPPVWLYPEFTEIVFPNNTWTEFVQSLDSFAPLCGATP